MIIVKDISKSYEMPVLDHVNMTVEDGAFYGLIGTVGSGKSTLMELMMGLRQPDSGELLIDEMPAGAPLRRLKKRLGYVPARFGRYPGMRISDYMDFFAACYELSGATAKRRIRMLLDQTGLSGKELMMVDSLSRGMQQKLSVARALLHDPRILLLDDPLEGLDPTSRLELRKLLSELKNEGKTLLVSSHALSELSELCTDMGILDRGRILLEGKRTEVMNQVNASSPILLTVEGTVTKSMRVLRKDRNVRSLSVRGRDIWIQYQGSREEEAALLETLVMEGIPVRGFHREQGNLEALFLQLNGNTGERVVTSYDAESDF